MQHLPTELRVYRLVQWCHGAPALLTTLATMHATFGSKHGNHFEQCMLSVSEVIWKRGLLTKGLGLCHGIAGNGYTFLAAYRANGAETLLQRARAFAQYSADVRARGD